MVAMRALLVPAPSKPNAMIAACILNRAFQFSIRICEENSSWLSVKVMKVPLRLQSQRHDLICLMCPSQSPKQANLQLTIYIL